MEGSFGIRNEISKDVFRVVMHPYNERNQTTWKEQDQQEVKWHAEAGEETYSVISVLSSQVVFLHVVVHLVCSKLELGEIEIEFVQLSMKHDII